MAKRKRKKKKKEKRGDGFCGVYSCGEAQSGVPQLYVENVIHWRASVKGGYRRAIQQLLQVASLRCNKRSDGETRVRVGQSSFKHCFQSVDLTRLVLGSL